MVSIKFHGTNYDNGLLFLHLRNGDLAALTPEQYTMMREDLGEIRFRSEVEIIKPPKLRQVGEYFRV
jgi:hypothetical protein